VHPLFSSSGSFGPNKKVSPPPLQWGGGGCWLFLSPSPGFGYGFEAVRIRVNPTNSHAVRWFYVTHILNKKTFYSHITFVSNAFFNPLSHGSLRNCYYTAWRPIGPLLSRPTTEKRGEVACRLLPCRQISSGKGSRWNLDSVARFRLYFKKSNFSFTSSSVPGCFYSFFLFFELQKVYINLKCCFHMSKSVAFLKYS
jgi:hypothetical protein